MIAHLDVSSLSGRRPVNHLSHNPAHAPAADLILRKQQTDTAKHIHGRLLPACLCGQRLHRGGDRGGC
jgi:hypothetical protein